MSPYKRTPGPTNSRPFELPHLRAPDYPELCLKRLLNPEVQVTLVKSAAKSSLRSCRSGCRPHLLCSLTRGMCVRGCCTRSYEFRRDRLLGHVLSLVLRESLALCQESLHGVREGQSRDEKQVTLFIIVLESGRQVFPEVNTDVCPPASSRDSRYELGTWGARTSLLRGERVSDSSDCPGGRPWTGMQGVIMSSDPRPEYLFSTGNGILHASRPLFTHCPQSRRSGDESCLIVVRSEIEMRIRNGGKCRLGHRLSSPASSESHQSHFLDGRRIPLFPRLSVHRTFSPHNDLLCLTHWAISDHLFRVQRM